VFSYQNIFYSICLFTIAVVKFATALNVLNQHLKINALAKRRASSSGGRLFGRNVFKRIVILCSR